MNIDNRLVLAIRWLTVLAAIAIPGCSRSPVVPVSGSLSFPDRDMPEVCRLTFVPTETDEGVAIRPGSATMDEDGNYSLAPFKGVEGLLPGTYSIRISYFDLKRNGDPSRDSDWKEHTFDAGELTVEAGSRGVVHDIEVR